MKIRTENMNMLNIDCMEYMRNVSDNFFDLALVDPPYGKDVTNNNPSNFVMTKHKESFSDGLLSEDYFMEIFRVSKNQLIFGANYYFDYLPSTDCMIVWDKVNPLLGKFSDFELIWTNFSIPSMIYRQEWIGYGRHFIEKDSSIHPTQKPVRLYKWLLKKFSHQDWKIFDPFSGSGTSSIACFDLGLELVACEIKENHYSDAITRIDQHVKQTQLFDRKL